MRGLGVGAIEYGFQCIDAFYGVRKIRRPAVAGAARQVVLVRMTVQDAVFQSRKIMELSNRLTGHFLNSIKT